MAAKIAPEACDFDYCFRIIVNGSSFAGKTSLLVRFADGTFSPNMMMTIGVDFKFAYRTIADSLIRYMVVSFT